MTSERIAILGLGYVGLPVAVALAERFADTTGFDVSQRRVAALRAHDDATGEIAADALAASALRITDDPADLAGHSVYIVTVPTPIDADRRPDLEPLRSACALIGPHLTPGAIVVFESTVYPGLTEDFCGPLLAAASGLAAGRDFHLGYSPERINPGDREHRLATITKIVAADTPAALDRLTALYGAIVEAGLHVAPSIRVAEAAKVLENTQRDLNIALMNELAIICDRMGIRTSDVLAAAGTKWNFLPFRPGLVGGHCIGVDPYYLTTAAERLNYRPQVILAGRRINDGMGGYVARKTVRLMATQGLALRGARVGILGLTFKEDVPDLRNSKVPDVVAELREYGIEPLVVDPHADAGEAMHEYGLALTPLDACAGLDALVVAVPHAVLLADADRIAAMVRPGGVVVDIKSALPDRAWPDGVAYWSL